MESNSIARLKEQAAFIMGNAVGKPATFTGTNEVRVTIGVRCWTMTAVFINEGRNATITALDANNNAYHIAVLDMTGTAGMAALDMYAADWANEVLAPAGE